jgi:hypothetical protein
LLSGLLPVFVSEALHLRLNFSNKRLELTRLFLEGLNDVRREKRKYSRR